MFSPKAMGLLILVSVLSAGPASSGGSQDELDPLDVGVLIERARSSLSRSLEDWGKRSFERRVLRERLDGNGRTTWSAGYVFRVMPSGKGFDEELIEIDGRPPTSSEIRKHRRAKRFARHYEDASSARLGNPLGADLPLAPLLFDQQHFVVGRETLGGVECVRLGFEARPAVRGFDAEVRLKRSLKGSLCITPNEGELIEGRVETERPVGQGVYKVESMVLEYDSLAFEESRLPARFEVRSVIRVGPRWLRKHNRYEYDAYRVH